MEAQLQEQQSRDKEIKAVSNFLLFVNNYSLKNMFVRQRDQGEEQLEINFLKKNPEIFSSKQSETS